jgi:hypothetical protein
MEKSMVPACVTRNVDELKKNIMNIPLREYSLCGIFDLQARRKEKEGGWPAC